MNNAKMGAAVLGGYMLGRTKKAKLALGLGAMLAGSRVRPGQIGKTLAQSPFLSSVNDQVRKELLSAGKAAATSVMTAKAEHLADSLHERTTGLREKAEPGKGGSGTAAHAGGRAAHTSKSTGTSKGHADGEHGEKKASASSGGSGHRASSSSHSRTAASAHRTSKPGGTSGTRETHEEETHGKARSRSSDGAHRTRRSGDD
ncbi:ABC transporter substrate-binding protein [Streptomyces telluris]|uniref:ABC transporter substrate-binding protein n=1 Tax=Streptomyces telluris TaxID=2720021 RepID=A0A9X2RQ44_9ACTN|nr:ABC transporter substrate-binding protein [Streptomyces telluris]MCQ8771885.1 ABC transporter substrate-binding protein [Streptomyces telluris]NJP80033.1 ABC transporter substrate-binding protein [Streptomyces telluris]